MAGTPSCLTGEAACHYHAVTGAFVCLLVAASCTHTIFGLPGAVRARYLLKTLYGTHSAVDPILSAKASLPPKCKSAIKILLQIALPLQGLCTAW